MGHAYVETLVSLTCNPDTDLALRNVQLLWQGVRAGGLRPMVGDADFTDHVSTIPDFSLHWIPTIARVYEHTGDLALVEQSGAGSWTHSSGSSGTAHRTGCSATSPVGSGWTGRKRRDTAMSPQRTPITRSRSKTPRC